MKVTDEILDIAMAVYNKGEFYSADHERAIMKAALEAVFNHVGDVNKMVEKTPQANDGWIAWGGGECPVDGKTMVQWKVLDVKTRIVSEYPMEGGTEGRASEIIWGHGGRYNVIAYRIAQEAKVQSYTRSDMLAERREEKKKKEPQKQALLEYAKVHDPEYQFNYSLIKLISDYLEANNDTTG